MRGQKTGNSGWKRSGGEFKGKYRENDGDVGVYLGDTTDGENFVEKMIRATLDYNKK